MCIPQCNLSEIVPRLRSDVAQCLVSFELVFPPSFFNIMTHLLVHLVEEIFILGPVFLHNMFPFERFMGVLKKYVHNRARQKEASPRAMKMRRSLSFVLTLFLTLSRLVFLNRGIRADWMEKAC